MVRTHSLLLRAARRAGYVVGGAIEGGNLTASPFLIHPIEQHTAGLYNDPVAVLDFASLYPSLIIAHNIDYSTLVVRSQSMDTSRRACALLTALSILQSASIRRTCRANPARCSARRT